MPNNQIIKFFLFEQYHGKRDVGSSRIRGHNLLKYWDEASLYQYGDKADVMIYQKVYTTYDYKFQEHFPGIQILDVCDPDWKDSPDIFIKETLDLMDAVVVPTQAMHDYLVQMTDTPVKIIKDRFDMAEFPPRKKHVGQPKTIVWFGYSHNAESIRFAIPSFEKRGLDLVVISNEDPACFRWAQNQNDYKDHYTYIKYEHPKAYKDIQLGDVCVMMPGLRPLDLFKSENKTVISQLCGLPVATNADELEKLFDAEARNEQIAQVYDKLKQEYDCRKSVEEYKELIEEIRRNRPNGNL